MGDVNAEVDSGRGEDVVRSIRVRGKMMKVKDLWSESNGVENASGHNGHGRALEVSIKIKLIS